MVCLIDYASVVCARARACTRACVHACDISFPFSISPYASSYQKPFYLLLIGAHLKKNLGLSLDMFDLIPIINNGGLLYLIEQH